MVPNERGAANLSSESFRVRGSRRRSFYAQMRCLNVARPLSSPADRDSAISLPFQNRLGAQTLESIKCPPLVTGHANASFV